MRIISKKYITESELQSWLDLTGDQLKKLRNERNFPVVRVTVRHRMYCVADIEAWLSNKRENIPGE